MCEDEVMVTRCLPDEDKVIRRLKQHLANKTTDTAPAEYRWSSEIYTSLAVFEHEQKMISEHPICVGPAQDLDQSNSYKCISLWNTQWIITKSASCDFIALQNQCRHRGMSIESKKRGRASRFVCPYHGWTYDDLGSCIKVPSHETAFPNTELQQLSLRRNEVGEQGGLLWMQPLRSDRPLSLHLQDLSEHFKSWQFQELQLVRREEKRIAANWKLIFEAFLESYHVPYVHKNSLAMATASCIWLNDTYGSHSRAVYLLKRGVAALEDTKQLPFRFMSVVYNIFPSTLISFQPFHVLIMHLWPRDPHTTEVEVLTLARPEDQIQMEPMLEKDMEFVRVGLLEDFVISEQLHASITSSPPTSLLAGRFEGQIQHFHRQLKL